MILTAHGGSFNAPEAIPVRWRGRAGTLSSRSAAVGVRLVLVLEPSLIPIVSPVCPVCAEPMPFAYCGLCAHRDPTLPEVLHSLTRRSDAHVVGRVLARHGLGLDFVDFCRVGDLESPHYLQARIVEYLVARGDA